MNPSRYIRPHIDDTFKFKTETRGDGCLDVIEIKQDDGVNRIISFEEYLTRRELYGVSGTD